MSDLPNDGDVIEFSEVPAASLAKVGVRYRVERKPLDREYLLIDVAAGHAFRLPAQAFAGAKWAEAKQAVEAGKPDAAPIAKPLDDGKEVSDLGV